MMTSLPVSNNHVPLNSAMYCAMQKPIIITPVQYGGETTPTSPTPLDLHCSVVADSADWTPRGGQGTPGVPQSARRDPTSPRTAAAGGRGNGSGLGTATAHGRDQGDLYLKVIHKVCHVDLQLLIF